MSSDELLPRDRLRTMQIIAAALAFGIVTFFGICMYLVYGPAARPAPAQPTWLISLIAGSLLLVSGTMSFILPGVMTQSSLRAVAQSAGQGDIVRLLGIKQTTLIVGLALLEGPGFFGLIAFLIERQPLTLAVPGLALLGMAARFPTESCVRNWMENHARRVLELRQEDSRRS